MRSSLLIVAVLAAACGSKKDSPPQGGTPPGGTNAPPGGKFQRMNGLITNAEGAVLCAGLVPASLKGDYEVTGGGDADRLTCNLKKAGKPLRSAAIDCKKPQSGDTLKTEQAKQKGSDLSGLGRAAFKASTGPVFLASKTDCTVTVYDFDPADDAVAFGKAFDDVLTPSNTPWPEK